MTDIEFLQQLETITGTLATIGGISVLALLVVMWLYLWRHRNDWVRIVGHLLHSNSLYPIHCRQIGLGALAMISLYVFGAIIVAILIYMAIVSYYI